MKPAERTTVTPRLREIMLPAGAVPGFDVGVRGDTGAGRAYYSPSYYRQAGYDGIRFIGQGRELTHILPEVGGTTSTSSTVFVSPDAGIVEFESLSLHAAAPANNKGRALHVGFKNTRTDRLKPLTYRLRDVDVVADGPAVWGIMSYQAFEDLEEVEFWTAELREHASYMHGFSPLDEFMPHAGRRWRRVVVHAVGGEAAKSTARPHECVFVPKVWQVFEDCEIRNWWQPHAWRGGAGMTFQGSSGNVLVDRCEFHGGAARTGENDRMRCIGIDTGGQWEDGQARFWGVHGGRGEGPANGHVLLRDSMFFGGPAKSVGAGLVTTYARGADIAARSFTMEGCGAYGIRAKIGLSHVESGRIFITGCNTQGHHDYAENVPGVAEDYEAQLAIPAHTWTPLSAGYEPAAA